MQYINLLIKIKNAGAAGKKSVKTPFTETGKALLGILKEHAFVKDFEVKGKMPKRFMDVDLSEEKPIGGIKFLSTPSLLRYGGYKDLKKVKGGHGILIVSTPKGIMSGASARREKVGGQLLCEIW